MLKDTILKYNKKYNNAPNNEKKILYGNYFIILLFIVYFLKMKNI